MVVSGIFIVFLLVGSGFLIYRNSSIKTNNNKSLREEKKPTLPPDNPQPDQPKNPPPQPDPADSGKTELKVFWNGLPSIMIDGYDDH